MISAFILHLLLTINVFSKHPFFLDLDTYDKKLVFWAGPQITSSIPHGMQNSLFEYQTHSQFASAFLGTSGRTKKDEFA